MRKGLAIKVKEHAFPFASEGQFKPPMRIHKKSRIDNLDHKRALNIQVGDNENRVISLDSEHLDRRHNIYFCAHPPTRKADPFEPSADYATVKNEQVHSV